ncbi:hypothetical protein [Shewanella gaetbuli]
MAFLCVSYGYSSERKPTPDASHYAFANYLGSGIYRTAGQSAAVLNIPLSFLIDEDDNHQVKLRLPVSFGFLNYSFEDLPSGEFPDGVGTLTVTPGIEYDWFVNDKLTIESYLDIGYGFNSSTKTNVGIFSTGVSSVYQLDNQKYSPIWVNRLYFAGYRSTLNDRAESYSVLQSGLDFGLGTKWRWRDNEIEPRLFFSGKWYFDELKFVNPIGDDVMTNHTYEVGATVKFSKPLGYEFFGWDGLKFDRLGLSYQVGGGIKVWRLIFEFPL